MKTNSILITLAIAALSTWTCELWAQGNVIHYVSPHQAETCISTDGGVTWMVTSPRTQSTDSVTKNRIIAFNGMDVLESTNGGRSWRRVLTTKNVTIKERISDPNLLRVYPIPVTRQLNVKVFGTQEYRLDIFSINGANVLTLLDQDRDGELFTTDVSSLTSGIYLLALTDVSSGQVTSTIITIN